VRAMKRICLPLVFLAACGGGAAKPPATTAAASADTGALVEGKVASGGVDIVYDTRGTGDTTLVFVHCWACSREYWQDQVAEFAKDYRVVTLDLGGHGESGDTRTEWTLASLGADVQAVVEKLDLKNVILVGHSMGGAVALEAAKRMPGRVVGIACADTLHDADRKTPPEMRDQILKAFETDFVGTMKGGMAIMFRPNSPKDVVEWVSARAVAAKPAVALPLMRELMHLELGPMLAAAKVPIRCVNAAPAGPFAPKTNIEGNRKFADFDAVIMEDVGHFLQLEKPAEFNAKLRGVLATWKK
jgi:pimeloyl-ACP methyl ester carboxylesterase